MPEGIMCVISEVVGTNSTKKKVFFGVRYTGIYYTCWSSWTCVQCGLDFGCSLFEEIEFDPEESLFIDLVIDDNEEPKSKLSKAAASGSNQLVILSLLHCYGSLFQILSFLLLPAG